LLACRIVSGNFPAHPKNISSTIRSMQKIPDIKYAEKILEGFMADMHRLSGKDVTIDRIKSVLEVLDNPHHKLKIIHIAGTSGKTSTAYYIASLLMQSGLKVGLTVSPHIDTITERIQLNNQPIKDEDFCQTLEIILDKLEQSDVRPTYFELLISMAYWYFAKQYVDYAVIETGLGGLHDATNIASRSDKVCVITDIGMDHMNILGDTIEKIAAQKAGIIHPGNIVFMHHQPKNVETVILHHIKQSASGAELRYAVPLNLPDLPLFQARNWSLAKSVYDYVQSREGFSQVDNQQVTATRRIKIPGRMDRFKLDKRLVIVDGAHNAQKMAALADSLKALYPNSKFEVIAAFKKDKEYQEAIDTLVDIARSITFISFTAGQDSYIQATDPKKLDDYCRKTGYTNSSIGNGLFDALERIRSTTNEPIIITGSLYLSGQARALLLDYPELIETRKSDA
jgi:dihydrofolate synthase / folylpolyglutamate synthase